ncbi:MAG: SAM-dependent methyltransferase [Actinomycetota bacterium]|nr:SAM-dependent methyltransferase [Actinomycetota bacterium]
MEAVSYTAQWTAAARALESERTDSVFVDPHARMLAGDKGFSLLERYAGAGTVPFLAIRTKYLDDAILATIAERGISQVVFIATGMDTRCLRLPWPDGVTLYELDRPALLEKKAELLPLEATNLAVRRHVVPVDLTGDWTGALLDAGFDRDLPTLWMAEGLFFFLNESALRLLLSRMADLSAGGVLAGDLVSGAALRNPLARPFLRSLEEDGAPWQFGTDEPERFLADCGWRVRDLKQPGEDGADYGRWPYPTVPREVPNIPRSFLFVADQDRRPSPGE